MFFEKFWFGCVFSVMNPDFFSSSFFSSFFLFLKIVVVVVVTFLLLSNFLVQSQLNTSISILYCTKRKNRRIEYILYFSKVFRRRTHPTGIHGLALVLFYASHHLYSMCLKGTIYNVPYNFVKMHVKRCFKKGQ